MMGKLIFFDGANRVPIGHEIALNSHDAGQWVSLAGYELEIVKVGGGLSFTVHREDDFNHETMHELFRIVLLAD